MGINKVQHPEWASPRCNNKNWITTVQHKELTATSRRTTTSCTTLSTTTSSIKRYGTTSSIKRYGTTSSIRRYGFNIVIYNIEMDKKNNHHLGNTTKDHISNKSTTEKIRLATIYGKNPTTTRRTTWMRYSDLNTTEVIINIMIANG